MSNLNIPTKYNYAFIKFSIQSIENPKFRITKNFRFKFKNNKVFNEKKFKLSKLKDIYYLKLHISNKEDFEWLNNPDLKFYIYMSSYLFAWDNVNKIDNMSCFNKLLYKEHYNLLTEMKQIYDPLSNYINPLVLDLVFDPPCSSSSLSYIVQH